MNLKQLNIELQKERKALSVDHRYIQHRAIRCLSSNIQQRIIELQQRLYDVKGEGEIDGTVFIVSCVWKIRKWLFRIVNILRFVINVKLNWKKICPRCQKPYTNIMKLNM